MVIFGILRHIGNHAMSVVYSAEIGTVKSGIGVVEDTVHGNPSARDGGENHCHGFLNLKNIIMIALHRLGDRQRESMSVCEVNCICGLAFLRGLICSQFSSTCAGSMTAVGMRQRQINGNPVFSQKIDEPLFPMPSLAPLSIVMVHCPMFEYGFTEKMLNRKMFPLASDLQLVEDGIDYLDDARFGDKTAFCHGKMRQYSICYCIFVKYSVIPVSYRDSANANYYGIEGKEEAVAYLGHEILGKRLREISNELLNSQEDIRVLMGSGIDVLKLKSSMTLFDFVSPGDVFGLVLDKFFDGKRCRRTLEILST